MSFFLNEKPKSVTKKRHVSRQKKLNLLLQKKWESARTPTKTAAKESRVAVDDDRKKKKIKMIKKRAHIASTILGLDYEEDKEEGKVYYLNADAKDKIDFRAYVAQIRDFLLGNFNVFSSTSSRTTLEESID